MPELPEVETIVRGLRLPLEGQRLAKVEVRVPALRWPLPKRLAKRLTGRRVLSVGRRAKYLLVQLDAEEVLLAHLGMSGRILMVAKGEERPPEPHDHIVLTTDAGTEIRFNDARRFGMVDLVAADRLERHKLLAGLGPEPLGNEFSGPVLAAALQGRATPIKAALLDQRVVAGLGNIYVSEALFESGIAPRRLARSVQGERAERLAQAVKSVLNRAIAAGGSSLRDYVQTSGELGYFQHQWAVYGKEGEPCPGCTCGKGVRRIVQSGRSTFYCAVRQR
ncbi:MAG TPA: bifunctional DNA-formamidopyrimidine glycosylase/DNA-(apurinic or apyrimidinic site) lyase [Kiloniellales bacterium]|nr:bifunctional DNA-formamidopyrimidine glycosylase/DNA-(apurinic or apyrimidinic site) lyase [Kiloniellales bacterium]